MTETVHSDDMERFRALKKKPLLAWPTLLLLAGCHSAIGFSWYMVLTEQMALWAGSLINIIAMYYLFSPLHDALHRAVSRVKWVNDVVLFIVLLPITPGSTGFFLRIMHMQHHRFANDPERDPDYDTVHSAWNALYKWFFWDFHYLFFYHRNKEQMPPASFRVSVLEPLWMWVLFAVGLWFIPMEAIFLWFLPVRMMAWLIAGVFMYLPHIPHDVKHEEDPWHATLNRKGWDWLLTPLLANQNWHLVHHLYPTVPFYRYQKIWEARRHFHESHNPAQVDAWQLRPRRMQVPAASVEMQSSPRA